MATSVSSVEDAAASLVVLHGPQTLVVLRVLAVVTKYCLKIPTMRVLVTFATNQNVVLILLGATKKTVSTPKIHRLVAPTVVACVEKLDLAFFARPANTATIQVTCRVTRIPSNVWFLQRQLVVERRAIRGHLLRATQERHRMATRDVMLTTAAPRSSVVQCHLVQVRYFDI
jgi:hypothetical protein